MDNLIAEGKAHPFIIVMDNGTWRMPEQARPPGRANVLAALGLRPVGLTASRRLCWRTSSHDRCQLSHTGRSTASGHGWTFHGWHADRVITLANPDVSRTLASSAAAASVWMMSIIHPVSKRKSKLVFVSFGSRELENRRPGGPFGGDPKVTTIHSK